MQTDLDKLKDLFIGDAMIGVLGPIMALLWWNATTRNGASPTLAKWIWIAFGSMGGIGFIAGAVVILSISSFASRLTLAPRLR